MTLPRSFAGMLCSCCGEIYRRDDEGTAEVHQQEKIRVYECAECETLYELKDEAKECCK